MNELVVNAIADFYHYPLKGILIKRRQENPKMVLAKVGGAGRVGEPPSRPPGKDKAKDDLVNNDDFKKKFNTEWFDKWIKPFHLNNTYNNI